MCVCSRVGIVDVVVIYSVISCEWKLTFVCLFFPCVEKRKGKGKAILLLFLIVFFLVLIFFFD